MYTKKILGVASAALVALGVAAGPASADTLLFADNNALVPVGTNITGELVSSTATLVSSVGTVNCSVSVVHGEVTENPGDPNAGRLQNPPVSPPNDDDVEGEGVGGTPADDLDIQFSNCTDNIPFYTVTGADGNADYAGADADNLKFTLYGLNVNLHLRGDITGNQVNCLYEGTVTGDVNNVDSTVAFNGASVTSNSGSPCPGSGAFTATYVLYETATGRFFTLVN